jgi:signal transduction histidine kinase
MLLSDHPGAMRSRLRLLLATVRLRLTFLYGGLFLVSGTGLLVLIYVLEGQAPPATVPIPSRCALVAPSRCAVVLQIYPSAAEPPITRPSLAAPRRKTRYACTGVDCADRSAIQRVSDLVHQTDLAHLFVVSWIALAIMALVSVGLGWVVASRVLRPLQTMAAATRCISEHNLDERLALPGPRDEITVLADTIDGLLSRLEQAFTAQRQFIANASHELRTPLARQRTLVQVALGDPAATVESLRAAHERALVAGEQVAQLIDALLVLARGQAGLERRESLDLAAVVGDVLLAREADVQRRALHIAATLDPGPTAGDRRLVERLVANLVDNAIRYNVEAGRVEVITRTAAGQAVLMVTNSGPVIPPTAVDRLFQPFHRLGAERTGHGDGLGLGLSIVRAIAGAHEATVRAQAPPGGGLTVEVCFPRAV